MCEAHRAAICAFQTLLVPDIADLLRLMLPNRHFEKIYAEFFHNDVGSAEENLSSQANVRDIIQQCQTGCLPNIDESVIQEMNVGYKDFIRNFISMSNGKLPLVAWRNFGFAPVLNTLLKLREHNQPHGTRLTFPIGAVSKMQDIGIEAGGGSGMGFQLICDGQAVLTAGGGGGGNNDSQNSIDIEWTI